jgi:hypothetical protein
MIAGIGRSLMAHYKIFCRLDCCAQLEDNNYTFDSQCHFRTMQSLLYFLFTKIGEEIFNGFREGDFEAGVSV